MKILIYGGLGPAGFGLTSFFLEEGIETSVVKSSLRAENEEEAELFIGRNALFQSIDPDMRASETEADVVCFANFLTDWKEGAFEEAQHLFEETAHAEQKRRLVVLFTIKDTSEETCDGPTSVYNRLEEIYQTMYKKSNQSSPWLIIRVCQNWLEQVSTKTPPKDKQKDIFQPLQELVDSNLESGLHIYEWIKCSEEEEPSCFKFREDEA